MKHDTKNSVNNVSLNPIFNGFQWNQATMCREYVGDQMTRLPKNRRSNPS